jgi:hypothetical protein
MIRDIQRSSPYPHPALRLPLEWVIQYLLHLLYDESVPALRVPPVPAAIASAQGNPGVSCGRIRGKGPRRAFLIVGSSLPRHRPACPTGRRRRRRRRRQATPESSPPVAAGLAARLVPSWGQRQLGYSPLNLELKPIDNRRHRVEGLSGQAVSPAASQFDSEGPRDRLA